MHIPTVFNASPISVSDGALRELDLTTNDETLLVHANKRIRADATCVSPGQPPILSPLSCKTGTQFWRRISESWDRESAKVKGRTLLRGPAQFDPVFSDDGEVLYYGPRLPAPCFCQRPVSGAVAPHHRQQSRLNNLPC